MMSFVKHLFSFPFLLFCLSAGLASCENDLAVVNSITADSEKNLPAESGTKVQIMYSDSAQIRAVLTTPILNSYLGKKQYREMPKGLEVIFYDEHHKVQSKLTADYAISFDNGTGVEHVEAKRNVIVINQKGEKLNTEHLIWNAVTKKIYTNEFVKISTKDEIIWGDGLTADQDFSNYTIKNVKGELNIKDEK